MEQRGNRMKGKNTVTRVIRLLLIVLLSSTTCGGLFFIYRKAITAGVFFTNDAWLGFWGSIIGSVVTMLGIILTLSFESKQNNIIRRLEAQPIIKLNALPLTAGHTENESTYSIDIGDPADEMLHFVFPDIQVQNIGLNFATNITLSFDFDPAAKYFWCVGSNPLSIIDAKETNQVSVSLNISSDMIYDFFHHTCVANNNGFPHACWLRTVSMLAQANRKESIERLEKVSYTKAMLGTTFEDIYGNMYEQKRPVAMHYVEVSGEEPFVYMGFPVFSEAELIKRKKIR